MQVRFRSAMAMVLVTGALCFPLVARGADAPSRRAEAKSEVERAEVQYKLGRFDEALEGYSRAYELVNAPGLLFDIGQCHRNLGSYERAIFFFQEYLREETRPERRALANQLIAESRSELEKRRQQPAEPDEAASQGRRRHVPTWREPPSIPEAPSPAVCDVRFDRGTRRACRRSPDGGNGGSGPPSGVGVLAIAAGAWPSLDRPIPSHPQAASEHWTGAPDRR